MTSQKGSKGENELGKLFDERDYAWMRQAGSGTANRELPDIAVGNGQHFIVFEVKRWGYQDYMYVTKKEVEDLIFFAEKFGAEYYIASRFNNKPWQFHKKEDLHETKKSYRIENVKSDEVQVEIDDICQ